MRPVLFALAACALAAGCSSPPKLPQASGSVRPANDAEYIAAIKARIDAENARRELEEATQKARWQAAMLQPAAVPQLRQASMRATRSATPTEAAASGANVVFTIRFALGATRPAPTADAMKALIDAARTAPLVRVRGRTDAPTFTAANDRTARLRAQETAAMLVKAGIEARRINVTWQAAGDTVASNDTPSGRDLNRRVEVEIYAADPAPAASPAIQAATVASN